MKLYKEKFEKGITSAFKRNLHYKKIFKLLNPRKKDRILDIGCADGELAQFLRRYSDSVIGIDINEELIKNSKIEGLRVM